MSTPTAPPFNFDPSDTKQPQLWAAAITTYCLAVIAVGLRFWSRKLLKAGYWLDDWLAVVALALATGFLASTIVWLKQGYGLHFTLLGPDFVTNFFVNLFVGEILYTLIICCVKFSILAFYWRLFSSSSIRLPIYILGGITASWGIAVILVTIFQCNPVSGFWNRDKPAKCIVDDYAFFVGIAVPNIVTDVALLALPLPYIWGLHRTASQKIALAGIFMLGSFVVIISIVRLETLVRVDIVSPDIDWNFAGVGIWTVTESNIAIVSACLPSCRPILSLLMTGSPSAIRLTGYSDGKRSGSSRAPLQAHNSTPSSTGDNDSNHIFVPLRNEADSYKASAMAVSTHEIYADELDARPGVGPRSHSRGIVDDAIEMGRPRALSATGGIRVKRDVDVEWGSGKHAR